MTTSTRHTERRRSAFTLAEVMVAASLSPVILAGVLSAFLMLGRSGYSELEAQSRNALALFGDEARQALDVQWHSAQSLTLTLPSATNATTLATYAYDSATRTFRRCKLAHRRHHRRLQPVRPLRALHFAQQTRQPLMPLRPSSSRPYAPRSAAPRAAARC